MNHQSILNYELANLYKQVKAHPLPRRRSDPVNTQIFVHNFDHKINLPPIKLWQTEPRSTTIANNKPKSTEKRNQSEFKSRRFDTLPSDIECINKFPAEDEKRNVVTSRNALSGKKQFIEIDILNLMTWYAKNDHSQGKAADEDRKAKDKFEIKEEIKEITAVPPKAAIPTFIQNYQPINEHINVDDLVRSPRFGVNHEEKEFLYFGELRKGQMDGKGVMVGKTWIFEGVWSLSKRVEGVEITPKGVYKGKFVNDERAKVGEFFWNNG